MVKKQCENSGTNFTSLFINTSLSINCRGLCFHGSVHINIPEIILVFTVFWVWLWKNLWQLVTVIYYMLDTVSYLVVCFYLFVNSISALIYRSRSASPPYTRRSQSRSPPPRRRSRSPPRRDRSRSPRRDRSPYDRDRRGRRWCQRPTNFYLYWVFHDIKHLCTF